MANSLTNLRELSVGIGFLFGNEIFSFSPNGGVISNISVSGLQKIIFAKFEP